MNRCEDKAEAERRIDAWARRYLPKKDKEPVTAPEPVNLAPYSSYKFSPRTGLTPVMLRALRYCREKAKEEEQNNHES